jgi:pimeloyl-ACP methyl ester carboxylesterase
MTNPTLVMLHGGGGTGPSLDPLAQLLKPAFTLEAPNLVGHGGREIPAKIRFDDWVDDLVKQLDERGIGRAAFFGYSVGGLLALAMARRHPGRVSAVCTLAAKYVFDRATCAHFVALCDPQKMIGQGGALAGVMEKAHHPQDWQQLCRAMAEFYPPLERQPAVTDDDLRQIQQPALIMSSGQDMIAPWQETVTLATTLPRGHVVIFPRHAHPLHVVPLKFVAKVMTQWFAKALASPA